MASARDFPKAKPRFFSLVAQTPPLEWHETPVQPRGRECGSRHYGCYEAIADKALGGRFMARESAENKGYVCSRSNIAKRVSFLCKWLSEAPPH